MEGVTVEAILHALSDPVRVAIYGQIAGAKCPQSCSDFQVVTERNIPKSTLSHHFKVLRDAGLIRSERHGVEMRNRSRCEEIDRRFPGLLAAISSAHRVQLEGKRGGGGAPRRRTGAHGGRAASGSL